MVDFTQKAFYKRDSIAQEKKNREDKRVNKFRDRHHRYSECPIALHVAKFISQKHEKMR